MSVKTICLLLCTIWLLWCVKLLWKNYVSLEQSKIVFCDVGQGDATLISHRNFQLLVDGGPDTSVLQCLEDELPLFDRRLEVVVLTHPDADHFTGLTAVLDRYEVGELWINNVGKRSLDFYEFYQAVLEAVGTYGLRIVHPRRADETCFVGAFCVKVLSDFREILPSDIFVEPQSFDLLWDMLNFFVPNSYNYNDGSIVLNFQFDHFSLLITGDAEKPEELALIDSGLLTDVDILKAGHHGSKSSSTTVFLSYVRPETSVISCGRGNQFGHPHAVTLETLANYSESIYRTDLQGRVRYVRTPARDWHWETQY